MELASQLTPALRCLRRRTVPASARRPCTRPRADARKASETRYRDARHRRACDSRMAEQDCERRGAEPAPQEIALLTKCAVELERSTIGRDGESRYTTINVVLGTHRYPGEGEEGEEGEDSRCCSRRRTRTRTSPTEPPCVTRGGYLFSRRELC